MCVCECEQLSSHYMQRAGGQWGGNKINKEGLSHPSGSNNEDLLVQVFRTARALKVIRICVPVG